VAIVGDRIAGLGSLQSWRGREELDAGGLAVAPGFVNMLSWASESLLEDGRAQSDVRQGVTLEVMGEGSSMGPLTEAMKEELAAQSLVGVQAEWTTLGEFLEYLVRNGVAPNVASFVGTATVREHELGAANRPPTEDELQRMQALVRLAMEEGAVGVASALVYAPGFYAATDELVALARVAGEHGGMYISHLRSEGNQLLEALDEFLRIAREAGVRAEIYHLKAAGKPNWPKLESVVDRIEEARRDGLEVPPTCTPIPPGRPG
jgi:N-acyl-D-amino-acid deacylase